MGLRSVARQFLLQWGIRNVRTTALTDVRDLLQKLKPVSSDVPLMRVGASGDGGYLIPDDLENVVACFSPGVAETASFELDIANRGIPCFLADYSVDRSPVQHNLFDFQKRYLGAINNERYMTLDTWVESSGCPDGDLILQMDIERWEYDVILSSRPELLRRFRTIVIEFHSFDMVFDNAGYRLVRLTLEKLLADFKIVHIHPNNCRRLSKMRGIEIPPTVEFTFHRNDRVANPKPVTVLPHALDSRNIQGRRDVVLPKEWYA